MAFKIEGFVSGYILEPNPASKDGYAIANLSDVRIDGELQSSGQKFVIKGKYQGIEKGLVIEGHVKNIPVKANNYGQFQLDLTNWAFRFPTSLTAIHLFISEGGITGFSGDEFASHLTEKNILASCAASPEKLMAANNRISTGEAKVLHTVFRDKWELYAARYSLAPYLSPNSVVKAVNALGAKLADSLQKNPYELVTAADVSIGEIDTYAVSTNKGIGAFDERRIGAAARSVLRKSLRDGSTALDAREAIKKVGNLISKQKRLDKAVADDIKRALRKCVDSQQLELKQIGGEWMVADADVAMKEYDIAKDLLRIDNGEQLFSRDSWVDSDIDNPFMQPPEDGGEDKAKDQRNAVLTSLHKRVSIVTGGPGVGKTTTVKTILDMIETQGKREGKQIQFKLCAPSGLAAKRMMEATGRPAQTVHKMLGIMSEGNRQDPDNPIVQGDVFVIDEASMMDVNIMHETLRSIPTGAKLIIVGDPDQLDSVGQGNVLDDIITSGKLRASHGELKQVFRNPGPIASLAKLVNANKKQELSKALANPEILQAEGYDRNKDGEIFFEAFTGNASSQDRSNELIADRIKSLLTTELPDKGLDIDDIQILAPQKGGTCGTENLNKLVQDLVNPLISSKQELKIKQSKQSEISYRVNDRVMNTKNSNKLDCVNGDIGWITAVDSFLGTVDVKFPEKESPITLEKDDIRNLTHAWCVTVHKSQGSEYKALILPVSEDHKKSWSRKLLYTAITRGKKHVYMLGDRATIMSASADLGTEKRKTMLGAAMSEIEIRKKQSFDSDIKGAVIMTPESVLNTTYSNHVAEREDKRNEPLTLHHGQGPIREGADSNLECAPSQSSQNQQTYNAVNAKASGVLGNGSVQSKIKELEALINLSPAQKSILDDRSHDDRMPTPS